MEKAIDGTLRQQKRIDPLKNPQGFLPKLFRGRCATPRLIRTPCPKSPKRDSMGLYEPPTEVTSLKSRHKVRQVRRLRCLERLYHKHDLTQQFLPLGGSSFPFQDMTHLWQAIRQAQGYGRSWDRWILQFEAVTAVPVELPTFDYLYTVRQITQYDADLYSQQEAKLQRQSQKHGLDLDVQYKSSSQYYKRLKAQDVKLLPGFPIQLRTPATVCRTQKGPLHLIIHQPNTFRLFAAARFGSALLRILDQQEHHVTCQILEGSAPTYADLTQEVYAFDLPDMAEPFQTYWSQFWNRDSQMDEQMDDSWSELLQSLRSRIPPTAPLTVRWGDPHLISQTIQKLKPFKAVGIDGWRAEELQTLPQAAIQDFATILASIWPQGLAPHQLIARVILLAKRVPPTSISDGRPITILGYISRLTSKLIADQLLNQWTYTWPSAISGGLPFRSVQDITFMQQYQIENAKNRSLPWRGFTLDLIKAFNLLPRRVLYHLLIHHGAPAAAIHFWFTNLSHMTRRLQIRQQVGPTITMTTGVPEGDSLSVCAMLVVSSAFYWTLQSPTVFPYAYADNWSYLTTTQRDNIQAFYRIQHLVEALRMKIDFAKSWAWGATKEARTDWKDFLADEFADHNQISVLNSSKDLGCMTHYTRHITLGHLKTKINSAVQRCRRLRWFQTTIAHKAQFIQTAIWPHAFFGAENQIVGDKHFRTLRREATTALVGPETQISSWLAVHLFSSQLQDPLLYVIATGLSFVRRLYHTNPPQAQDFVNSVIAHQGNPIGPAGALARYLQLVGWSLTTDGTLTLDGYLSISLQRDSLRHIRCTLRHSWAYYLNRQICHRKGVPSVPFDYTVLSRVLRSMSSTAIRQIAYNLTGGYQVGAVKAQWTSTVDTQCPHCGEPDTHAHQQLDCPTFMAVRLFGNATHKQLPTSLTIHRSYGFHFHILSLILPSSVNSWVSEGKIPNIPQSILAVIPFTSIQMGQRIHPYIQGHAVRPGHLFNSVPRHSTNLISPSKFNMYRAHRLLPELNLLPSLGLCNTPSSNTGHTGLPLLLIPNMPLMLSHMSPKQSDHHPGISLRMPTFFKSSLHVGIRCVLPCEKFVPIKILMTYPLVRNGTMSLEMSGQITLPFEPVRPTTPVLMPFSDKQKSGIRINFVKLSVSFPILRTLICHILKPGKNRPIQLV